MNLVLILFKRYHHRHHHRLKALNFHWIWWYELLVLVFVRMQLCYLHTTITLVFGGGYKMKNIVGRTYTLDILLRL